MNQTHRQSNECLIDFLRFSLPDSSMEKVADLLGIALSDFTSEKKGSPFPTYDSHYSFADIIIHQSDHHNNRVKGVANMKNICLAWRGGIGRNS